MPDVRLSHLAPGALLVLGLAAGAAAAEPAPVTVVLTNDPGGSQVMRLDRAEVPAGKVSFKVRNESAAMTHEFLVVRTELAAGDFPMSKAGDRVDERKLKGVKELGDVAPGKSGVLALTLRPGHYVLFCNETGHFRGGMHAELAVGGQAAAR